MTMKKNLVLTALGTLLCFTTLASCGAKATTTTIEAEEATMVVDPGTFTYCSSEPTEELNADEEVIGKYVRFMTGICQDTDEVKDTLTFNFTSDKEATATIVFYVANPKSNPDSNWNKATKASDITKISINGSDVDMTPFDTAIGTLYDGAATLDWKQVSVETTLKAGANTVVFENNTAYPVTYEGMENLYSTDSICIDKIDITTTATITK